MSIYSSFFRNKPLRFSTFVVLLSGLIVATTFQNCGKAGFEATEQQSIDFNQQQIQSDITPFAYETAIDQLTYLSCSSPGSNGKAFTFKVGAYDVKPALTPATPDMVMSGARITKAYIDWAKQNVKPNYDPNNPTNVVPTATDAKVYLSNSKKNEKAQVQFSMRKIRDIKAVYSKTTATYGIDIVPLMGILSDDRWLTYLMNAAFSAADPAFVNFFPLADAEERVMEGALYFNQNEDTATGFRNEFDSNAFLTLGYDDNLEQTLLRSPAPGSKTVAYGLGYKLLFQQGLDFHNATVYPNGVAHPWNPRNTLASINEINLETGKDSGRTWTCPVARRYSIVRREDQAVICPKDKISRMTDANYKKEFEILRRHFPAKDYDVSVDSRCIVPLTFRCYRDEPLLQANGGTSYGMVPIQYNMTQPCFYNSNETRNNYPASPPTPYCAEVASICVRN